MSLAGIETLGVVGAGQMGGGIARTAAEKGCRVLLSDLDLEAAQRGRDKIGRSLARGVAKGKVTQEHVDATLDRLVPVGYLAALGEAGLIIEAASEDIDLKLSLFEKLDAVCPPGVILATNTSSISITRIAAVTDRPAEVIGMHFMNPVHVMKLVEVIKGLRTSNETVATTVALAESLGKVCVEARDFPGFAVNRILMPMINEAFYALYEGIADAEGIDNAMKLGTNQPMGPLALADFIGLDTCLAIMEVLHEGFGDTKYRPCPLLRKYVEAGTLGQKTGLGVYGYEGGR
ncbi:MAG: 3-hydroxyacyl-CoA dehydrogenase NAD-binding domain-containing protein [Myxococcota bacterium]|nr:3-hydroxyacyl-CoA dehydrogenase NAD-binding domain-containing protein [Myxococcota bacterium]